MLALPQACALDKPASAEQPDITVLFKAHYGFVWRVLSHFGVQKADQEDALQEVFMVVHRRLADYREQDKIRAWLYAICARVAKNFRRSQHRRREQLTDAGPERSLEPSQASDVSKQEALVLAQRLLEALPEAQRAVFLLYEVEQMPMTEVALAVGCPVPTAYARLRLARERVLAQVSRAQLRGDLP